MVEPFLGGPVSPPRPSASIAPLSPSAQVVQPSTPSNVVGQSSGVVTWIPSATFASPTFMQSVQSGPSVSTSFVYGLPGMEDIILHPLFM